MARLTIQVNIKKLFRASGIAFVALAALCAETVIAQVPEAKATSYLTQIHCAVYLGSQDGQSRIQKWQ
jgi:hypothetical protein